MLELFLLKAVAQDYRELAVLVAQQLLVLATKQHILAAMAALLQRQMLAVGAAGLPRLLLPMDLMVVSLLRVVVAAAAAAALQEQAAITQQQLAGPVV